jgi:hypothetical protein
MVFPLDEPAGNEFDDAAYNMAAVTATIALYRALVRKGVVAREEARQEPGASKTTMEINDQSVEILKFIAEHL